MAATPAEILPLPRRKEAATSRTMSPPILILRDIHLTFGGTPLLEGADLSVSEGERLCLVGRNGSGKSTLLKIAAGLIEASSIGNAGQAVE